jgi:integrase
MELEREAAGIGVPRAERDAVQKALSEHLDAFLHELRVKGRAIGTTRRYKTILTVLWRGCGWKTLRDVDSTSFTAWRWRCGFAPKYANDILAAARTFFGWLERQDLISVDPLRRVEPIARVTSGNFRRSLSVQEVTSLLEVAPASRAWVYLFIVYTGLRRAEMNALCWSHLHLECDQPFVDLPAEITKNRKSARQPLRTEVVTALRAEIERRQTTETFNGAGRVFLGRVPSPSTLRRDLAAADIPAVDLDGRRVDLHALRTTFGTLLSASGVTPRVAMELMRHSDLKLTMRIYTDASQLPLSNELKRLPTFEVGKVKKADPSGAGSDSMSADQRTLFLKMRAMTPEQRDAWLNLNVR